MEGWLTHRSVLKSRQSFVMVHKEEKKHSSNSDIFKILPIANCCNRQVSCSWSVVSQIKSMLYNACHLDCKNKGKHLDLLLLVYVNCVHNTWRLIVWQWWTKPCKEYLSNSGQFPCEMDWKECDSVQKTILKLWPFNLMKSGNFTCSKAPLKLETSICLYIVLKTAVDLCTHAHVDIIVWELGYSSLVGSA